MSNLSVKLDDATRERLKTLAAREGITPHALMVQAIGGELERIDARQGFVERATQALARAEAGAPVFDGTAYADHLRARVQATLAGRQPAAKKPKPLTLATLPKPARTRA